MRPGLNKAGGVVMKTAAGKNPAARQRFCRLVVAFSALIASVGLGREQPLANADRRGLYARSVEQVLRLRDEQVDLATAALIISEQYSDMVNGRRYRSKLDDMALEIRNRLREKGLKANHRAVEVINEYLFEELGFRSVSEANDPNDLFLHSVLDKRRGYCLSLSMLYLSLGERLGMPLYGVVVPGHFFVRYDDGKVRFNIETTGKGGFADDRHYIDEFGVPQQGKAGIYIRNLAKKQTLGCFLNNLGNTYSELGDSNAAQEALERAVEINPGLAESHLNLGNVYLKCDRVDDAIYEYEQALRINPREAKTHSNLGNAYGRAGRLNEAVSAYIQAVKLDPNFVDAYKNLASAYCRLEMFEKAVVELRQAAVLAGENADIYNELGGIYSRLGDFEQAIVEYERALAVDSDMAGAYYGLAVCYNKLGMEDSEVQAYRQALAREPGMAAALINLGNVYFRRQEYDSAIELYTKAARIQPDDADIRYNLGAAYSNKGDYGRAIQEYLRVVELDRHRADAHQALAVSFYKLGNYRKASEHIQAAMQLGAEVDAEFVAAVEQRLR